MPEAGNYSEYNNLQQRQEKCVCKSCGSKLEIRLIIYNQYGGQGLDLYCPNCGRVEYGVDEEVYRLAKSFVDTFEFNYYTEMAEDERNYQLNVGKVSEIVSWLFKNIQSPQK